MNAADVPYDFRTDRNTSTRNSATGSPGCASAFPLFWYLLTFPKGKVSPRATGLRKYSMILEDLQHQYEGFKQRIALVRSYL